MQRQLILLLAVIVVFTTTYSMVLPASAIDTDTAQKQAGIELEKESEEEKDEKKGKEDSSENDSGQSSSKKDSKSEKASEKKSVKKSAGSDSETVAEKDQDPAPETEKKIKVIEEKGSSEKKDSEKDGSEKKDSKEGSASDAKEKEEEKKESKQAESARPVKISTYLTEDTGLWVKDEQDKWVRTSEDTAFSQPAELLVRISYEIPQGKLSEKYAAVSYKLPKAIPVDKKVMKQVNDPDHKMNQVTEGTRLPGEKAKKDEQAAGSFKMKKTLTGTCQLEITFDSKTIEKNADKAVRGWLTFTIKDAELDTDKDGKGSILFSKKAADGKKLETTYSILPAEEESSEAAADEKKETEAGTETGMEKQAESTDESETEIGTETKIEAEAETESEASQDDTSAAEDEKEVAEEDEEEKEEAALSEPEGGKKADEADPKDADEADDEEEEAEAEPVKEAAADDGTDGSEAADSAEESESESEESSLAEADDQADEDKETAATADTDAEDEPSAEEMPAQNFEQDTDTVAVKVFAEEGAFPAGTTMQAVPVHDQDTVDAITDAVRENGDEKGSAPVIKNIYAVDITFYNVDGEEIEPEKPVCVIMEARDTSAQTGKDSKDQKNNKNDQSSAAADQAGSAPLVVHVNDIGEASIVDQADAGEIPADVSETPEMAQEVEAAGENDAATVFSADGFSVYAVVYTVDFQWEMDGQSYDFSMAGGSGISLRELLTTLKVVKDDPKTDTDEIQSFMDSVEDVTFSSPELVWLGRVKHHNTIADIKEYYELECQYSAGLSEEEIDQLNAKEVEAGDWAVISLQPFTSEESLTITMKDGDQFTVKVTDAMPSEISGITSGNNYVLYIEKEDGGYEVLTNMGIGQSAETRESLDDFGNDCFWNVDYNQGTRTYKISSAEAVDFGTPYTIYLSMDPVLGPAIPFDSNTSLYLLEADSENPDKGVYIYGHIDGKTCYMSWNEDEGFFVTENPDEKTIIYLYEPTFNYTIEVLDGDISRGTVSGTNIEMESVTHTSSFEGALQNNNSNKGTITAEAKPGYRFAYWMLDGTELSGYGHTIEEGTLKIGKKDMTLTAVFEPTEYTFAVRSNNSNAGTVGGFNSAGQSVTAVTSFTAITDEANVAGVATNRDVIIASANDDHKNYHFVQWELTDANGEIVKTVLTEEIAPGELEIREPGMTLTAIFAGDGKTIEYQGKAYSVEDLDKWYKSLESYDPPFARTAKSAEVYDYENRIYQINFSASSGVKAFTQDMQLGFLLDVSNSMLFPTSLTEVGATTLNGLDNLINRLSESEKESNGIYFAIGDERNTATVYALKRAWGEIGYYNVVKDSWGNVTGMNWVKTGEGYVWYGMDASYYAQIQAGVVNEGANANATWRLLSRLDYKTDTGYTQNWSGDKLENYSQKVYSIYKANDHYFEGMTSREKLYSIGGEIGYNRLYELKTGINEVFSAIRMIREKNEHLSGSSNIPNVDIALATFAKAVMHDSHSSSTQTQGNNEDKDHTPTWTTYGSSSTGFVSLGTTTNAIETAMDNSTSTGGTRQDKAMQNAAQWTWGTTGSNRRAVILITDGAPNGASRKQVTDAADSLRKDTDSNPDNDITLVTVGLSMDHVENGPYLLDRIASELPSDLKDGRNEKYYYRSDDASDLKYILYDIINILMADGVVQADVTDKIDEVFYPVNKTTGLPLVSGNVIDLSGTKIADTVNDLSEVIRAEGDYGVISVDSDGIYTVTWGDQDIPWEHDGGWQGTVLVKAKENFLGGNGIPTNIEAKFVAEQYNLTDESMAANPHRTAPIEEEYQEKILPVPHVNVDELSLDQNETAWTLYMGTEVTPVNQIKALYRNLRVREVVTEKDADHLNSGSRSYSLVPASIEDGRARENDQGTFLLSEILPEEDIDWEELLDYGFTDVYYSPYGHDIMPVIVSLGSTSTDQALGVGRIRFLLDKNGDEQTHTLMETGEMEETYLLKIQYVPWPSALEEEEYYTGDRVTGRSGHTANDTNQSENLHVINVFSKPLDILKTDIAGDLIKNNPAEFSLYRAWKTGDPENKKVSLSDYTLGGVPMTGDYFLVDTQETDENGIAHFGRGTDTAKLLNAAEDPYYIVETRAPEHYMKSGAAKSITLNTGQNTYTDLSGAEINDAVYPYNWEQGVKIESDGLALTEEYQYASFDDSESSSEIIAQDTVINNETVDVKIIKEWDHGTNTAVPSNLTLTLTLSDGTEITLPQNGKWEATVEDLPKYNAATGEEIQYSWTEGDMPPGYFQYSYSEDTVNDVLVTTIKNVYTESYNPKTSFSGYKIWDDDGEGRPDSVVIVLYKGEGTNKTEVARQTITEAGGWHYHFSNIPIFEDSSAGSDEGKTIVYSVAEILPAGFEGVYTSTQDTDSSSLPGIVRNTADDSLIFHEPNNNMTISTGVNLGFIVVKHGHIFLIWTPRKASEQELSYIAEWVANEGPKQVHDNEFSQIINNYENIWGVPNDEIFSGNNRITFKMVDEAVTVNFGNKRWSQLAWGQLGYTQTDGNMDIKNSSVKTGFSFYKLWREFGGSEYVEWKNDDSINVTLQRRNIKINSKPIDPDFALKYTITRTNGDISIDLVDKRPQTLDENTYALTLDNSINYHYLFKLGQVLSRKGDSGETWEYFIQEEPMEGFKEPAYAMGEEITMKISGDDSDKALKGEYIVNAPFDAAELPSTGGSGTTLFYLFGLMLTGLAGAGLLMKRRRRNAA